MTILQRSLAGSGIILAAMLLRLAALNRLPKRMFVALWMLAAVRMLLPYTLPCSVSVQTLAQRTPICTEAPAQTEAHRVEPNQAVSASNPAVVPARIQTAAPRGERTLPVREMFYFMGLAVCALALITPHLKGRRLYAQAIPAEEEAVRRWLSEKKGKRRVRVGISDRIAAPMTYGLLRPRILLPAGAAHWEERRMMYVLEHEWMHIRGGDVALKGILAAALCAHWFNPLAWAMFILAGRDMELACDEAVIRRFGPDARAGYAETIIDLAAERTGRADVLSSAFSRSGIEERIRSIMKMKKRSWLSLALAAVLVLGTAAVFATNAEEASGQVTAAGTESEQIIGQYMLEDWTEMRLQAYREALEEMWENHPESEEILLTAMQDENLSGETLEFVQYVLVPVTTEWERLTGAGWSWTEELEWGTEDQNAPSWLEVTFEFSVPSPQLLSTGHFRDAVKDVRERMLDWPEGAEWDTGHTASWYDETDEAVQYAEGLSGRAAVLCERWNSDLLKVDIGFVQASREQQLLRKYIPLGLNYKFYGYVDNYKLEMTYDGRPVHSVWDNEEKVIIQNNMNGYDLGEEAIDLTVEYENGRPSALRILE